MRTAFLVLLAVPLFLSACASERPQRERGWIGGRFIQVVDSTWFAPSVLPSVPARSGPVVGLPADVAQEEALLAVLVPEATPLARAGVRSGDLLVSIDGRPVPDADELYDAVGEVAPGTTCRVGLWREGELLETDVVTGREVYERVGKFSIGLGFSGQIDLWPFDGDFDVLGLVRFGSRDGHADLTGPEAEYLRAAFPGEEPQARDQAGWYVRVVPFGVGKHDSVVRQELVGE